MSTTHVFLTLVLASGCCMWTSQVSAQWPRLWPRHVPAESESELAQSEKIPPALGCYRDVKEDRDLWEAVVYTRDNTPALCIAHCKSRGYAYAAVQAGSWCKCGNSYDKHDALAPTKCDMKCSGDSSLYCGGRFANDVFSTGNTGDHVVCSPITLTHAGVTSDPSSLADLSTLTYQGQFMWVHIKFAEITYLQLVRAVAGSSCTNLTYNGQPVAGYGIYETGIFTDLGCQAELIVCGKRSDVACRPITLTHAGVTSDPSGLADLSTLTYHGQYMWVHIKFAEITDLTLVRALAGSSCSNLTYNGRPVAGYGIYDGGIYTDVGCQAELIVCGKPSHEEVSRGGGKDQRGATLDGFRSVGSCQDDWDTNDCSVWASEGSCSKDFYLLAFICKKSCNFCEKEAVNGNWGTWAAWSACSVTCGAGTKTRERYCDNPPAVFGGKYCRGIYAEIATCDEGPCPAISVNRAVPYCGTSVCSDNARCVFESERGGPTCQCNAGYSGDGVNCSPTSHRLVASRTVSEFCNRCDPLPMWEGYAQYCRFRCCHDYMFRQNWPDYICE